MWFISYLYDQIDVPLVLVTGDGSVSPDHQIPTDFGRQVHVLTFLGCRRGKKKNQKP